MDRLLSMMEFHIFASNLERHFTMKKAGEASREEFSSLIAASSHARSQANGSKGILVVHN